MRKGVMGWAIAILLAATAAAQVIDTIQVSAVSTGACNANTCAVFQLGSAGSVTLQTSGTFVGTLTAEATSDGINWATVDLTDLSSQAATTTVTGAGQYAISNSGLLQVRLRATAWTSGTAIVVGTRGQSTRAVGGGGGAPSTAQFWLGASNASLTNGKNLGALATGLVLNTAGTPSAYGGTGARVANSFITTITGAGVASSAQPAVGDLTGLGTGVGTALGVNVGSAGAFVVFNGALGTPSSGVGTNLTGVPISTGISGLGTGVATWLVTPSSANLAAAVTDETGSGGLVFATSPTLTTPILGVATVTTINKVTVTQPATGSTLTVAEGVTLTASATANVSQDYRTSGAPQFARMGLGAAADGTKELLVTGTTNTPVKIVGTANSTSGVILGAYATNTAGIWTANVTPSTTNYALAADSNNTFINAAAGAVYFSIADVAKWKVDAATGHFYAQTDNQNDIGASGATRPRTGYFGTSLVAPTATLATLTSTGKYTTYNNVATTGWGMPSIYGTGRSTGQTAAVTSVATYTCGAADGTFLVTGNVNVTTTSAEAFNLQVTYTDETNTARTLTMPLETLAGASVAQVNFSNGAVPYSGTPVHLRVKASTAITIKTVGTFTGATYNVEGSILQIG